MILERKPASELMDQPEADPARLAESLRDLAWFNRYLGGTASVVHQLERLLQGYEGRRLRVLDVAAGAGDILSSLRVWCEGRGLEFRGVALDRGAETTRLAAGSLAAATDVRVVRGDARRLPFPSRAFDVSISSTFLHHLEPGAAATALRELARVSDWGWVVSDLRRTIGGRIAAWCLAHTLWRTHPYARHDGPASMRAAYTLNEAVELARRAGLEDAVAEAQPTFRWALRWRRPR